MICLVKKRNKRFRSEELNFEKETQPKKIKYSQQVFHFICFIDL